MMREFIVYLKERGDEELIEAFFVKFWDKRFIQAVNTVGKHEGDDLQEQVEELASMLEREGFMQEYEVEQEKGQGIMRVCNCPYWESVWEISLPCVMELRCYLCLVYTIVECAETL